MPASENITSLKTQRGNLRASLTRFEKYLNSLKEKETVDFINLQRRINDFEPLLNQFNKIQSAIEEDAGLEEGQTDEVVRMQFEHTYYELITAASKVLEVGRTNNKEADLSTQIRLPVIELPKFSGLYEQWFPFYDVFVSLIDTNKGLSGIQKFHYLKSSLEGEAKTLMQSLEMSSDNYQVAWQLLKSRYDNKRIIVKTHLNALFGIASISKESCTGLRKIVGETRKHLQALKALKRPVDHWDDLMVHLVSTKLDSATNKEWENKQTSDHPSLSELLEFIEHKCRTLETLSAQQPTTIVNNLSQPPKFRKSTSHVSAQINVCSLCEQVHRIQYCPIWLKMSVQDRFAQIKALKLCVNCLKPNHSSFKCSGPRCKICHKKHHYLLHIPENVQSAERVQVLSGGEINTTSTRTDAEPITTVSSNYVVDRVNESSEVLLSTAVVCVNDINGKPHFCRALLDCGSQSNFIQKGFLKKLKLPIRETNISVTGVGQSHSIINKMSQVIVKSRYNSYSVPINCLVIEKITENLPLISLKRNEISIPNGINLADPTFYSSAPIEMLIGADNFWSLLCVGQIRSEHHPLLQETQFGWLVTGRVNSPIASKNTVCNLSTKELSNLLERFWAIEENFPETKFTAKEQECELHFRQNVNRDSSGRFSVKLPFSKDPADHLGDSREQALRRFYSMEKKLEKQPLLQTHYRDFMNEYLMLGHMRLAGNPSDHSSSFYLPHHAVVKDNSATTKVCVVFDASAKSANGNSLNDVLMTSPTLQEDVFAILLRFRKHKYVLTADITKMYRQILVDENDRHYQKIFWRNSPMEKLREYELNTVTYGTAPASFLAVRCLHQLAEITKRSNSLGSTIICSDFYMDDLLTGANTEQEALRIRDEVTHILLQGGFELRKWSSNNERLLDGILSQTNTPFMRMDKAETNKTLGILWNSSKDSFQFTVPFIDTRNKITKRNILAEIARVFDPLGLINPIILTAKILMQQLWKLKTDWDAAVPPSIHDSWVKYREQLPELNDLVIPRKVAPHSHIKTVEVHGFCDASEEAYGACVYLRSVNIDGEINVSLLASKSRVAPIKAISLPRLELCGAVLLAQLTSKVLQSLRIKVWRKDCFRIEKMEHLCREPSWGNTAAY